MAVSRALHPYANFVHKVEKPVRYLGGELFQVEKDWATVEVSICLAFPDVYDIGMSHLGTKILYKVLNDRPEIACERAFAPWMDMEKELRERKLPIVSLETMRPLRDFDVIGCSLQFELTFTNVLTILDLSGLALRADQRGEDDPLVIGGGPVATHPEVIAPFFDAFLIGDGEGRLPELLIAYKRDRLSGLGKREALIRMAAAGGVYVPALYEREIDPRSGLLCVTGVVDERVPMKVVRAHVPDINAFPFPDDSPVAAAEAIFDRLSIEIARGCTEGCRFCQAGMIYRPVRERDPNAIVDTIVSAIDKGGYDEASLTALSTADYSCIDPLVKKVMEKLRERRVSLGVSSLRAYGLNESLLDEIRSVRATGLTFAPEAGTQRMRDIINKNVSEEDVTASAHRIFSRGWERMKCYFMIGLPLEHDEDVVGIPETASRLQAIGRKYVGRRAEVTASCSSHVPKPHTPFQWAAMDTVPEIQRKQVLLRDTARQLQVNLKYHDVRGSYLEGIFARGDLRVAEIIEVAFRRGARFDGWDEGLKLDIWLGAMKDSPGFDPTRYLGTLPVDGRLPWDHIDVGLEDGFLSQEWKRATKERLSPPCGKPKGNLLHHTNLRDHEADSRKLVCYHCGVACDLNAMRSERAKFLSSLGAYEPPAPAAPAPITAQGSEPQGQGRRKPPVREDAPKPADLVKYRLRYSKAGLVRLQGHSDMLRIWPRIFRRAGIEVAQSYGFNPKPIFSFSPALPLGAYSVSEYLDVALPEPMASEELVRRLNASADPGLEIFEGRVLHASEKGCGAGLNASDYLVVLPGVSEDTVALACRTFLGRPTFDVKVERKGEFKSVEARSGVKIARLAASSLWPDLLGVKPDGALLHLRYVENVPSVRAADLVPALLAAVGAPLTADLGPIVRLALWRGDRDGRDRSPMEPPPVRELDAEADVVGDDVETAQ